jgi:hypothetical protein
MTSSKAGPVLLTSDPVVRLGDEVALGIGQGVKQGGKGHGFAFTVIHGQASPGKANFVGLPALRASSP